MLCIVVIRTYLISLSLFLKNWCVVCLVSLCGLCACAYVVPVYTDVRFRSGLVWVHLDWVHPIWVFSSAPICTVLYAVRVICKCVLDTFITLRSHNSIVNRSNVWYRFLEWLWWIFGMNSDMVPEFCDTKR